MRFCHLFHAGPGAAPSFRAGQTLAWRKHTLGALPSGFLAVLTEGTRGGSPPLLSQRQPHLSGPPPPPVPATPLLPTFAPFLEVACSPPHPQPSAGLSKHRDPTPPPAWRGTETTRLAPPLLGPLGTPPSTSPSSHSTCLHTKTWSLLLGRLGVRAWDTQCQGTLHVLRQGAGGGVI